MTKIADVSFDPKAKCPKWLGFLDRIFPKPNLIGYVQRAAGYSLTGDNSEEKMFMLYGKGRNGKSTLMLTLHAILADYSQPMSSDLLMAQGDRNKLDAGQLSAIAALRGARFVAASETDEGARVSEKTVKQLVKRDAISAKFMGKDMFDFLPTHKLWLCTNHRLRITGKELGLWSAMIAIPFDVTIPDDEIDRMLPAKLMAERSGILNWLLAGCLEWQAKGSLGQPTEIDDAIRGYRKEMDIIQPFLDACCVVGPQYRITSQALRSAYDLWCKETVKEPIGVRTFGRLLEEKFPAARESDARFRQGLQLNETWQGLLEGKEQRRGPWGDRD
jgi:putative DNA primase/helicase